MTYTERTEALRDRYVAIWNEDDPKERRAHVRELWSDDARHLLQPPQEVREQAAALGFPAAVLEARGHDQLEERVARAHDEFVASGKFAFRARGDLMRVGDMVKFGWEMVDGASGEVAGAGVEVLILDHDDRISLDYQFIEP
jgi:hypothetical protein